MWKRLEKAGERELKMHPVVLRENAALSNSVSELLKKSIYSSVSNKIYVRHERTLSKYCTLNYV